MGLPGLGEVESLKEGIAIANRQKGPAFATRKLLLRPDCLILLVRFVQTDGKKLTKDS